MQDIFVYVDALTAKIEADFDVPPPDKLRYLHLLERPVAGTIPAVNKF